MCCRSTSCCCYYFRRCCFYCCASPNVALGGSALVYALAWRFDLNLPAYPNGVWFFNPFAWQLLFVFGAWCALGGAQQLAGVLRSRVVLVVAIVYLVFAFLVTLTWQFESLDRFVPGWLADWMYPIDKTNLDVLRFAHFLALAAVTVRFVPRALAGPEIAAFSGRPSSAASIRWKSSALGCFWPLPANSLSPNPRAARWCKRGSAC